VHFRIYLYWLFIEVLQDMPTMIASLIQKSNFAPKIKFRYTDNVHHNNKGQSEAAPVRDEYP